MPPSNTPTPTAHVNGHARKRTAPVAIPLALSKPRPVKTQPKPEEDVRVGAENVTPVLPPNEVQAGGAGVVAASNGLGEDAVPANGSLTPEAKHNGIAVPDTEAPSSTDRPATDSVPAQSTAQSSGPSTSTTDESATASNNPELTRKPTERFDMRQIRTELPPAFVPSAEQHTPRSNTSSQPTRPPQMPSHAHPSHPSAGSIVFGGHDSSSSSPGPPQSAGSAYQPPPFPNVSGTSAPAYQPNGHAHHASDSHGSRTVRPTASQPVPPYSIRQGYGQQHPGPHNNTYHPHAHMPFRQPPPEAFTPVDSPHGNGNGKVSRSASQTSSAAADPPTSAHALHSPMGFDTAQSGQGPRRGFVPPPNQRQYQAHMQPPPPQYQSPEVTSQLENADALRQHIFSQFAMPNTADCLVRFTEGQNGASQTFNGHRLVLSRSPRLMRTLAVEQSSSAAPIEVVLPNRHIKLAALTDALKYMYGGPLLPHDHQRPASSAGERTLASVQRIEHALSYVATGSWLGLPAVAVRGVEVAGSMLHWDTIPTALAFALEGGLSHMWTVDDGSEDGHSASSSDDSLGRHEVTGTPAYEPYSTALLQRILDFTIHVFPSNFYLDSSAPQLESCPRLPPLPQPSGHESRSSVSDPRLSQIRFGEIPVGPSFSTTMISSILLSLPFQLLKAVLEHFIFASRLGTETAASVMRQVVGERERRRIKAQQARTAGKISSGSDAQLLQNLYWEEFVEPTMERKVGFRVARRRTGIDTPLSSGPE